jgi:hypothetical protein
MRICAYVIILIFQFNGPQQAAAAQIKIFPNSIGEFDKIIVSGEISEGDELTFYKVAEKSVKPIVYLTGPGGAVSPALEIGRYIFARGFPTIVEEGECASACALIWLAGGTRYVGENAKVGFHAVYTQESKRNLKVDSIGNALVGAYLNRIGLNADTVAYVTSAPPSEMRWISERDAKKIGLIAIFDEKYYRAINDYNIAVELSFKSPQENKEEIIRLYASAANDGFAGAQNNYGNLFQEGNLVPEDRAMAIYWYTRSAERGEPFAYLGLADLLSQRTFDQYAMVEALKFAILAVAQLPKGPSNSAALKILNSLTDKLPAAARAKAETQAKQWTPLYQETALLSDDPAP